MAIKANIVIDQGTDFEALIDIQTPDEQPFDLRDWTSKSQMRKTYASSTAYDFDVSDNGIFGQIAMKMSKDITSDLEPGRYLYDIEITSISGGTTQRVVEGIVTVTPGITRT